MSEFFNARTLSSIVGHAALVTKGSDKRLRSSVVFRHLFVYYSTTSSWNYKAFQFAVTRTLIPRGYRINYRTQTAHALPPATCCFSSPVPPKVVSSLICFFPNPLLISCCRHRKPSGESNGEGVLVCDVKGQCEVDCEVVLLHMSCKFC